jgi:hypothetical protein
MRSLKAQFHMADKNKPALSPAGLKVARKSVY